jgi:hypothetical protein
MAMAAKKKKPSPGLTSGKKKPLTDLAATLAREKQEATRAKNAQASIRGKMVDIGRGNEQAGRQGGRRGS